MPFALTPATGQAIRPPEPVDVAAIDFIVDPTVWTVTRGVGENSHIATLRITGGPAQACQTNVILQTSFPGGDSTDISPEALGPGTLLGATLNDGYLRIIGNAGDGAGNTLQYLYWQDPVLVIAAGAPKTGEFFLDATELVSNPPDSVSIFRWLQIGASSELRLSIEGFYSGANRLTFEYYAGGTVVNSWVDTVDCYSAGRRHVAISIYDDPMAVANTVDLYVAGTLVHTLSYGQLTATTGRVQWQGGTQVFPNRERIDIPALRFTNERLYSGASFTQPTEFLPPCALP